VLRLASPTRTRDIFGDGQGVDVADTATIEVPVRRMVTRVRSPPVRVRRQREDAEQPAEPVVCPTMREERAVPAIVLDQEQPHEQTARDDDQRQRSPINALRKRNASEHPRGDEWNECYRKLEGGAPVRRRPETRERARPLRRRPATDVGGFARRAG